MPDKSMAQGRFVNLVAARVRRYNKDILWRFIEGKLYDQKLTWWWYLFTTGKENMGRLTHELAQESILQDTKPSRNPGVARLKHTLSAKRRRELKIS